MSINIPDTPPGTPKDQNLAPPSSPITRINSRRITLNAQEIKFERTIDDTLPKTGIHGQRIRHKKSIFFLGSLLLLPPALIVSPILLVPSGFLFIKGILSKRNISSLMNKIDNLDIQDKERLLERLKKTESRNKQRYELYFQLINDTRFGDDAIKSDRDQVALENLLASIYTNVEAKRKGHPKDKRSLDSIYEQEFLPTFYSAQSQYTKEGSFESRWKSLTRLSPSKESPDWDQLDLRQAEAKLAQHAAAIVSEKIKHDSSLETKEKLFLSNLLAKTTSNSSLKLAIAEMYLCSKHGHNYYDRRTLEILKTEIATDAQLALLQKISYATQGIDEL